MTRAVHSSLPTGPASGPAHAGAGSAWPSAAQVEALVDAALVAHRAGALEELLHRRPRLTRWVERHWLQPLLGAGGDALRGDGGRARAVTWLLRWGLAQLRPDRLPGLTGIDHASWLERTSWRPLLALMCQHGFEAVPDFPQRYRRRADEPVVDNLCGLWAIGPSTLYRALDKGRRQLAAVLRELPRQGADRLSLRAVVDQALAGQWAQQPAQARQDWHQRQATQALVDGDPASAWWHHLQAHDVGACLRVLQRARIELASHPETPALIAALAAEPLAKRERFDLCLAQAALWRIHDAPERERQAYEQALRLADEARDDLLLGAAYGALGKFHEARDADRAFACYQDSADFLRRALEAGGEPVDARIAEETLQTLTRLAWVFVLRNDPRSRAVLDNAQALRDTAGIAPEVLAALEQTWGEYWRRAGEIRRALEHKHRALNLYERIGDQQSVLKTYGNLALLYGDAKDFPRAIEASQRVLALAERIAVEPETVASTHLNLGATWFWQGRYEQAIQSYTQALQLAERAGLALVVRRAHYNLAEAHFKRFQASDDPADEQRGDSHVAAALAAWPHESDPAHLEAARNLKAEILGPRDDLAYDRLLPQESVAHAEEIAEVHRQRAALAVPGAPAEQVRATLRIARAYLRIAAKEREAAQALAERHGLGDAFAAEFAELQQLFSRDLTRAQQLADPWQARAGDMLDRPRQTALLQHLLAHGHIHKSAYARLCSVGPATASKHLAALTERGLLRQTGRGPATRYSLPE